VTEPAELHNRFLTSAYISSSDLSFDFNIDKSGSCKRILAIRPEGLRRIQPVLFEFSESWKLRGCAQEFLGIVSDTLDSLTEFCKKWGARDHVIILTLRRHYCLGSRLGVSSR